MQMKYRDGVRLAFSDGGHEESAVVLIHGWGCDHTTLLRQQGFFAARHRVLNVDLRGHGESAKPEQAYSVAQFADDVAWLCAELGIRNAFVIGHSMGGAVALEIAHRHPALVYGVAMIDTVYEAPAEVHAVLAPLLPGLAGEDYENTYRALMSALSLPSDLAALEPVLASLPSAPQQVLLSSLKAHLEDHDFATAALGCRVPVAYIGATRPLADVGMLKHLMPTLATGQIIGAGHFAPLLVPEQVNDMLLRFHDLHLVAEGCLAGCV